MPTQRFEGALRHGDLVTVASLLDASPGLLDRERRGTGWTPLHLGAWFGHPRLVGLLLSRGSSVDVVSAHDGTYGGSTPLHLAVARGHRPVVELLLARGADPNRRDAAGFTALHTACARGDMAVVRRLVDAGADVNAWVGDNTPLSFALQGQNEGIVDLLRGVGAIC